MPIHPNVRYIECLINCFKGDDDLRFKKRPVIAVTGSAGKTTTKEMVASILQRKLRIFKSKGNMNLPRFISRQRKKITSKHKALILEYGMFKKGHIRRSCRLIQPNIGVVTMVGTAHIGNFGGSVKRVAGAKSELIRGMRQTGTLFLNADDRNSRYLTTKGFKGRIYKVAIRNKAKYKASRIRYTNNGMSFNVKLGRKQERFRIPIFGKHNVYNALFAIGISRQLGIPLSTIRKGLITYQKPERRLRIYHLKNKVTLVDDSFSANPQATNAAIDALEQIGKKKRIAVLGDMLELGIYTKKGHRIVGAHAAKKKIHHLLTYGSKSRYTRNAAVRSGLPSSRAKHFTNRGKMHSYLKKIIKRNATILVKGSHKMKMNRTVKFAMNTINKKVLK
ncbi:UDP-N-acetylmuramoyl-tripeptide--D-alanyl-D-alanine ligase [Paenibacillus tarimensis]